MKVEPQGATRSYNDLVRAEGKVLEIVQFSGLFCSSMSLTFSSEIRLAKLHDVASGTFTWVKGGNLSGNFSENFGRVQWSTEVGSSQSVDDDHSSGYFGPKFALLNGVSVSS
jgi:hypothetical protein